MQILQPLAGPKVGEAIRKTVNDMFGVFAQSMAAAFQKFMRPDGTFPPRLGARLLERIVSHGCVICSVEQSQRISCSISRTCPCFCHVRCEVRA